MSQMIMDELQRDQELLREEVNQVKTHMSMVIGILQALLKKEGNLTPISAAEMLTPLHLFGFTSDHGILHGYYP